MTKGVVCGGEFFLRKVCKAMDANFCLECRIFTVGEFGGVVGCREGVGREFNTGVLGLVLSLFVGFDEGFSFCRVLVF